MRPGCRERARSTTNYCWAMADDMELLTEAANLLAQAQVPREVPAGVALTRMTAIRKPGGGVRGIATGDMFRRLVSRSHALAG